VDLSGRLMMLIFSLFVNRTPETQSAAAGGRSSSDFCFNAMPQAAIRVDAARPPKYTSSGVRYWND